MNKQDLIVQVADATGLGRAEASRAVESVFDVISNALKRGDEVRLVGFGTGSMISPNVMVTNHYVLDDPQTAAASRIEFDVQDGVDGTLLAPSAFGLDPEQFFFADPALDFTIVAVAARPEELAPFGYNRLIQAEGKVLIGESVSLIGHPRGWPFSFQGELPCVPIAVLKLAPRT